MVWAGLIVGLLSALVACYGDLKRPRTAKGFWAFLRRNRLPAISALLAMAGFAVAGFTVMAERKDAARGAAQLQRENDELKTLALIGRGVRPVVEVVLGTSTPLPFEQSFQEEIAWHDAGRAEALPRPFGFVPSAVRSYLFPQAQPDPLLGIVGKFDLRTGRGDIRIAFHALKDGSVIATTTPLHIESLKTSVYEKDHPAVAFEFSVSSALNAIDVYQAVMRGYDHNVAPIVLSSNISAGATQHCVTSAATPRRGRLTIFLDDNRQFAMTALLREQPRDCGKSHGESVWLFAEAPTIKLSPL